MYNIRYYAIIIMQNIIFHFKNILISIVIQLLTQIINIIKTI